MYDSQLTTCALPSTIIIFVHDISFSSDWEKIVFLHMVSLYLILKVYSSASINHPITVDIEDFHMREICVIKHDEELITSLHISDDCCFCGIIK